MDINPFELAGKTLRRTYETIEDTYSLSEEVFCHSLPMKLVLGNCEWARGQSATIMDAAHQALKHSDVEEAAHQFRRELYFSSLVDKLAGSPDQVAAQVGLDAMDKKASPSAIEKAIDDAWTKALYEI